MSHEIIATPTAWSRSVGLAAALALAGCATLPSSGPTAGHIERAVGSGAKFQFDLIDIDEPVATSLQREDAAAGSISPLAQVARDTPADVIGPGDVLEISIYEVGVSLFSGGSGARSTTGSFDPSARAEKFPSIEVSAQGTITLPYIGILPVGGRTTGEVQRMIEHAMVGSSQRAQALVIVSENVSDTVYVSGEVRKPGRVPLSPSRERLFDVIASAGGTPNITEDMVVRFSRSGQRVEERLAAISPGSDDDIEMMAGDRIELVRRPRSYVVLGAAGKVSQITFDTSEVSLAEAIARVGGPSDATADPSAVFLFRDTAQTAKDGRPVIYRLNLLEPASYILAQRMRMRDKDVLYFAPARANQPAKLLGIINLLFSPFITARQIAR